MILPSPAPPFQWVDHPCGPALVCRPLARIAPHVFTTRGWPLGSAATINGEEEEGGWKPIADALDVDVRRLARVRQLHGANVAVVRADGRARQDADIIVSAEAQMALAVRGADCVPLLMADSRGGPIGAAHAGWRGLAARVPYVAVAALADQYGSRPVDLIAAAGPSIGACCYEVGDDVRDSFVQAGFTASELDRWFLIAPQPTPDNPTMPGLGSRRDGHWFFDGWTATRDQLIAAGVAAENIFMSGACTASHPDVFCSYRRDGAGTGRLVGAIRSAESPGQRPSRR